MKFSAPRLGAQQNLWRDHLDDVLQALGIVPGPMADNISASVATYCREFHPAGLQTADLRLLIARAFCAVGDHEAAARILGSMEPQRRHVLRWLEILSELHHFPQLLPYFSLGVIRPADWAGARLDRMWVLDFTRLSLSDSERHEMMLYRSIRVIMDKLYVFWDATKGEGILGLKGLGLFNVEGAVRQDTAITTADNLVQYISDLLNRQVEMRGWTGVPSLLNLDF